jgi:hypothetical protein
MRKKATKSKVAEVRTPLSRMYCGKMDLVRPRVTMDDLAAREATERMYREMKDIYDAEMAAAQAAPAH